MRPDYTNSLRLQLIEEIRELEDAYAEALSDNTDARTLSAVWDRIKMLTYEIKQTEGTNESFTRNG